MTVFEWFKCSSLLLAPASTLTMIDWDLPGQIWLCGWSNCWTISASKGCRQWSCWVNEVIGRNQILKNSIYKFWRVLWRGGDVLHPQFPAVLLFCCWVGVGDVGFFSLHFFFSSLELCCKSHCTQHWPILKHGCMSSLLWNDKRRTSTGLFTVLLPSAALVCYLNIGPYIYL